MEKFLVIIMIRDKRGLFIGLLFLLAFVVVSANAVCEGPSCLLTEGETIVLGDSGYLASINFITFDQVRLKVGDEVSAYLEKGSSHSFGNGIEITITDILYNSKDSGVSKVEFTFKFNKDKGDDEKERGP